MRASQNVVPLPLDRIQGDIQPLLSHLRFQTRFRRPDLIAVIDRFAAFCFTCCFAVFVVSPLCFQKALPFCELRFAFCSKDLLPSVIKSDL